MGTGRFLKEQNPDIKVIAIEPPLGERVEGLRNLEEGYIPPVFEQWYGRRPARPQARRAAAGVDRVDPPARRDRRVRRAVGRRRAGRRGEGRRPRSSAARSCSSSATAAGSTCRPAPTPTTSTPPRRTPRGSSTSERPVCDDGRDERPRTVRQDPEPTEVFPPLPRRLRSPTPPADLPPIGSERDPDPTTGRWRRPQGDVPTTAMPSTRWPVRPGPALRRAARRRWRRRGGDEPPFEPEPEPWYRQPGPLAALIAGVAALIVARHRPHRVDAATTTTATPATTLPTSRRARRPRRRRRRHRPSTTDGADDDVPRRRRPRRRTTTTTTTTTTTDHHDDRPRRPRRPRRRRRRRPSATDDAGAPLPPGQALLDEIRPTPTCRRSPTRWRAPASTRTSWPATPLTVLAPTERRVRRPPAATRAPTRTRPSRSCCCTSSASTSRPADLRRRRAADARRSRCRSTATTQTIGSGDTQDRRRATCRPATGLLQVVDEIIQQCQSTAADRRHGRPPPPSGQGEGGRRRPRWSASRRR